MEREKQFRVIAIRRKPPSARSAGICAFLPLLILALPAVWMLAVVPPLWRDLDAYVQVTSNPGAATVLLYSPWYCFPARLPLYLGYLWEKHGASGAKLVSCSKFFRHAVLTDTGVFFLALCQQALLVLAAWMLVRSISKRTSTQIVLAALVAANAPLYTFAHTVGTESASLCGLVLLCAIALHLFNARRAAWSWWAAYVATLTFCVLVRHINGALPVILPAAFLLSFLYLLSRRWVRARRGHSTRRAVSLELRHLELSVAAGILSLALASVTEHGICSLVGVKYQSIAGFAFSWRLNFLTQVKEPRRTELLAEWRARLQNPLYEKMFDHLPEGFAPKGRWDSELYEEGILREAEAVYPKRTVAKAALNDYRNRLERVVLASREPAYFAAVFHDYGRAWSTQPWLVAVAPFDTTAYFFTNRSKMEGMSKLTPFQGDDAERRLKLQSGRPYFRLLRLPYTFSASAWLLLGAAAFLLSRRRRAIYFSAGLLFGGSLLMFLNIALTEFQVRYTLPFWMMLSTGILINLAVIIDAVAQRRSHQAIVPAATETAPPEDAGRATNLT